MFCDKEGDPTLFEFPKKKFIRHYALIKFENYNLGTGTLDKRYALAE